MRGDSNELVAALAACHDNLSASQRSERPHIYPHPAQACPFNLLSGNYFEVRQLACSLQGPCWRHGTALAPIVRGGSPQR